MKIEIIDINEIKPFENNAKLHPQEQIDQIKQSIEEFGNNDPIAIDENNVIIEGHGRYEALKQLNYKAVECIRLSHLTEEQKRAYILVHNKLTMNTGFNIDLLNTELEDIFNIDMEFYGFEIKDPIYEKEIHAEETQRRVENILNLEHAQFEGVGKYDTPQILPVYDLPEIKEWIGFNYVLSDNNPEGKAVHFFIDDYQFERLWNNPDRYIEKLKQYVCVASPDFSPYGDMPLATQIFNHYRKHWVARYLQENGVTVIPTIRSSTDPRSLDFYLDGEPSNSIVLISNMWTGTEEGKKAFDKEYKKMVKVLNPSKIFVYGKEMNLKGNIEYIQKFTDKRWNND